MNLLHKSNKVLISGASGTGKSTYFTEYVNNSFRTLYSAVFIFDHQGEFSARTGIEPCLTPESLTETFRKTGLVVFDPSNIFPGETDSAWDFFCEWVFELSKESVATGPKLLAVDELQMFASTSQMSWELSCVVETGRKFCLDFAAITQQLNLLHNRLRNQATELVSFRATDPLILQILEDRGFNAEEIRNLPTGQFVCRDLGTGEERRGNVFSTCKAPPNEPTSSVDEEGSAGTDPDLSDNNSQQ